MGEKKKFLLRLDPQIYDALERWAADEYRSVNSHVEFMLREALKKAGRMPGREAGSKPSNEEDDEWTNS